MKNAIDFLIDISDKMDKKLTITQTILQNEIIPYLNFDENIGMRTFLSVVKNPIVINSLDMGLNTKSDFMQKAGSLPFPNGGSPIGHTIKESLKSLRNVAADCKRIVLVTAGEETDGGNYEYEIEHGHEGVQVNIIGIGINESDKKIAERASAFTGGVFCEIPEEIFNNSIEIANQLKPLIDALQGKTVAPTQPKEEPKEEPKKEETDTDGLGKFEFKSSIFKNIFNKDDKGDDNSSENVPPIARRGNSLVNRHIEDESPAASPFKPFIPRKAEAEAPAKKGKPASEPEVASTPKRDELMEVQTPQVFRYNKLLNSYVNGIKKNIEATDDLSLAEAMHYKAHLVEGSYSNIKITTPEDIKIAETLLNM